MVTRRAVASFAALLAFLALIVADSADEPRCADQALFEARFAYLLACPSAADQVGTVELQTVGPDLDVATSGPLDFFAYRVTWDESGCGDFGDGTGSALPGEFLVEALVEGERFVCPVLPGTTAHACERLDAHDAATACVLTLEPQ